MRNLAMFVFSLSILGTQIVWTRIFSFSIWYHFAFLVISVAMLGFTSGGLLLNLKPKLLERAPQGVLAGTATGFAAASSLALLIVINLPFDGGILESAWNLGLFAILIGLVAGQFFFAGLYVAFAIASDPKNVSRVYFANMTGSGVGCAASVLFLDSMLPTTALLAFALVAVLSALLLVGELEAKGRGAAVALGIGAVILGGYVASMRPLAEPFYLKSTKDFPALEKERIIARTSNSFATLDIFHAGRLTGLWGLSPKYHKDHPNTPHPPRVGYCIDSWALTFSYGGDTDITQHPVLDYLPAGITYSAGDWKDVLVVGAGGGIDVIQALHNDVDHVTAVEINPAILDAGLGYFAEWNQGIFHRPEVTPVVAEGRSFLTAAGDRKWDMIQLSGVDTLAASQAGAFTLSENYLYSLEAFRTYLDHVKDDGVVTLTRWVYNPPRQTLRVVTLADAALRSLGIENTADHMMLVADPAWQFSVILFSPTPFSEEQVANVERHIESSGFIALALPGRDIKLKDGNLYQELVQLKDKQPFIDDYPFDISVTTDNKPFFMEHSRWSNAWSHPDYIFSRSNGQLLLLATTFLVGLFALIFIGVPARMLRKRDGAGEGAPGRGRVLGFFSCLGLGYVLIEVVLVQKLTLFLGNPQYALAVVLCAMLIFSGIGASIAGRMGPAAAKRLPLMCASVTAVVLLYVAALDPLTTATLSLPLGGRIALVLATLSLPGLLMGMPFPTAIAALGDRNQGLVVGGWILNGYFSVLASCLTMILSMATGFLAVLVIGAAVYALAALLRPLDAVGANAAQ